MPTSLTLPSILILLGLLDRLKMHASLQKYDFLQFLGHVQFFRLTFQRALLGWASFQFTFRKAKTLPQSGLHPEECSKNTHYWWWCFPITCNSTLFNYLSYFSCSCYKAPEDIIHDKDQNGCHTNPSRSPVKQVLVINYILISRFKHHPSIAPR